MTLRVVKWSDATYVEDQDQWWHGGITRVRVPLSRRARSGSPDVRAIGGLAEDLTTGTLDLRIEVGLARGRPRARLDGRGRDRRHRAGHAIPTRTPLEAGLRSRGPEAGSAVTHGARPSGADEDGTGWPALHAWFDPPAASASSRTG